jgi:diguanylate cyclase
VHLPVAVNIAARSLLDGELPDRVSTMLARHLADAEHVTLEITESAFIAEPERALQVLGRLRRLGVRLSIDDFGTGYSSMAYLQTMPLDELKVDRRFVGSMHGSTRSEAIVRATVDLGHALGLRVVAEGVEDEATWEALAAVGCDQAQGYHLCRPIPAPDLLAWLSRSHEMAPALVPPSADDVGL